jgi:hypothetical protein
LRERPSRDISPLGGRSGTGVNPLAIATLVFICAFGGALLGMLLHTVLPADHLGRDTKDVVTVGMGLIATMTVLVLGPVLLVGA